MGVEYDWEDDAKNSYLVGIAAKREEYLMDTVAGLKRVKVFPDGGCELYLGDCLEIMPQLGAVDAVVTDPPYGIGAIMNGGTWGARGNYVKMREWDMSTREDVFAYIGFKKPMIVWGGNYYRFPPSRCWLAWVKRDNIATMSDFELAWTNFDRPAKEFFHARSGFDRQHQTAKPVALMKWCLGFLPDDAHTVLDPFMGSGTTLVACVKTGRKGIGIEIDPDYFDIACRRVEEAYRQPDLFVAPPAPAPEQTSLTLDD